MSAYLPRLLAQLRPDAGVLTDAYVVPEGAHARVGVIVACNVGADTDMIRIAVALAGAGDALKQYLFYDWELPVGGTKKHRNVVLGPKDALRVYSTNGNVAFNILGIEVR